ncbi:MAG: tetratricopeptide repeat protein [Gemmatimonadota bacterium]|nr:tetratricopeptide repeat protein [Gemmatimonadota bacterium]
MDATRPEVLDPAAITTRSPFARRLFAEGLTRLYSHSDPVEAARLFESALREDSSCAMCAYAAARAESRVDMGAARRLLLAAVRHSVDASGPERLVIRQWWAAMSNAPGQLALAESLAHRYPDDPESVLALAAALQLDGRFLDAVPYYVRVLQDVPPGAGRTCPRCEAHEALVHTYWGADSIDAAVRVARDWTRDDPESVPAWMAFAWALALADRYDDAVAATDAVPQTDGHPATNGGLLQRAMLALRADRYDTADAVLQLVQRTGTPGERESALWWRAIALRYLGRPGDALQLVQGPLRWAGEHGTAKSSYPNALLEGQILLELGRAHDAAQLFRALSSRHEPDDSTMPGLVARRRSWALTHAGTALAALGDTVSLAALVDTVEIEGQQSALARDHHLHHYLRGLLWIARRQPDSARVTLGRATQSRTHGFTRAGVEEARQLLAAGRATDAISMLRLALRGEMDASNLYVSRPEMHELLARAYDASEARDSAIAHFDIVVRAWADGDGAHRTRAASARARMATLRTHTAAAGTPER